MKIAVPVTQTNEVDSHFGHCEFYNVFTISDKNITEIETVKSPKGCGCKSNIVTTLSEKGVQVMLAGNMGSGAVNILQTHGIKVVRGCKGASTKVVEAYLANEIVDNNETCHEHEDGHQCEH